MSTEGKAAHVGIMRRRYGGRGAGCRFVNRAERRAGKNLPVDPGSRMSDPFAAPMSGSNLFYRVRFQP